MTMTGLEMQCISSSRYVFFIYISLGFITETTCTEHEQPQYDNVDDKWLSLHITHYTSLTTHRHPHTNIRTNGAQDATCLELQVCFSLCYIFYY